MHRLSIRYEGRVQGVGFRATVATIARDYPVVGRVCNVADGRVELLAEAEQDVLIGFRDHIARVMRRNIVDSNEQWQAVNEANWKDFAIGMDLLK